MKLRDRTLVEGTMPSVYIGHREFKDRITGQMKTRRKWHAEFNHDGRKFDEPLRTSNKQAAIRAAHKIIERIERGDTRQVQRKVEWQEMWDGYIKFLQTKGRAPKTLEKYEFVLTRFMEFAKERKRLRPGSVTPADFWAFNHKMTGDGLHQKTKGDRLIIIKQWWKWATLKAKPPMLAVNHLAAEEIEEGESSVQPCFTPEQVCVLLANACKDHERIIYAVMAYLGLRFGEVRDLEWGDFNFNQGDHGWVTIQRGGSNNSTKGKMNRRIPVNEALRKILDELPRRDGVRIFFQRPSTHYPKGDRPLSERRLLLSLKRLCKRCGFQNPQQYKLHTFRHAFASMLARSNVGYKQALAWMGHQDSKILDLYITMFDPDAERAMKTLVYSAPTDPKAA